MNWIDFYLRGICMWLLVVGSQTTWTSVVREGKDPWWLILSVALSMAFWALLDNTTSKRGVNK